VKHQIIGSINVIFYMSKNVEFQNLFVNISRDELIYVVFLLLHNNFLCMNIHDMLNCM
jgi:hypothetical protein